MGNALTAPQQGEPAEIVSGDKAAWRRDDLAQDYSSAGGWTLSYRFVWSGASATVAMTADSEGWKAVADAATWAVGLAQWFLQASHATYGQTTLGRGAILVAVNPASPPAGFDPRSHARRVLTSIEAAIEGRATQTDLKTVLADGRAIDRVPPGDLVKMRDLYAAKVRREERAAAGKGLPRVLARL